jgi:hypothetical protein
MVKDGKDVYNGMIVKHQNTNRSVGNVTLSGAITLDAEVLMFFEPYQEGKIRASKTLSLRDILKKVYVKIGSRKIPVFLYIVKTHHSRFQLWYWDAVPEIHEFVVMFSCQGPACCHQWGWDLGSLKRLFQASFDSLMAISSMNSRWNAKKNCAMGIEMSAEAAAMLNFGSSPFILKAREDKQTRQKKEKGVIERGNLRPEDIRGVEADDLASLGDVSNTETVFDVSDDEYEDDDIEDSKMMTSALWTMMKFSVMTVKEMKVRWRKMRMQMTMWKWRRIVKGMSTIKTPLFLPKMAWIA